MKWHYADAFSACVFALLWGYEVSESNTIMASFDVLLVVMYVVLAERSRRDAALGKP